MFKKISLKLVLLFATLLTVNLWANTQAEKQQLVDNIVEVSGINDQFSTFDIVMEDTISRMLATNAELNTDEKQQVKSIILKDLNQQAIVNSIKDLISKNMSEEELQSAASAYQSDIMQKIKTASLSLSKPEVQQEFTNFTMNIGKNPPSTNRLNQVKKLDEVLHASKFQAELMGKMLATMMTSFNQLDNKLSKEQLSQTIKNVDMFMQEAAKEQVKMSFLFTYKDLSDEELDQYINTEETTPGLLALNKNIFTGVSDFFAGYSSYLGTEIAKFTEGQKKIA